MSQLCNYLENALMNHMRGNASLSMPASLWIKLHIGNPGEDATANAAANTTRRQVTLGAPTDGVCTNTADVDWTSVPNAETYSHISIWDASSAGNPLWYGALSAGVAMGVGETFRIPSGQLSVSLA